MRNESWATRWRRSIGLVLVLCLAMTAACSGDDDEPEDDATASAEPGSTTTIDPASIAPLTGLRVDDVSDLERSPLVVKIDNVEAARPQAGIDEADIIMEERVEGDVTRLVAVFHSSVPDKVGPVRSTRSTDFDLLPMFGRPVYASSGGNSGVMSGLADVDVIDVGHNAGGTGFERESGRSAPHNLMATPSELYGRAGDEVSDPPPPVFTFADDDERPAAGSPVTTVGFSFGGSEVSRFDWNEIESVWVRSQRGTPHAVVTGDALTATNIVAVQITYTFGNPVGTSNPHGVTTGEGPAMVFLDGRMVRGTWSRPSTGDPFELRDEAGQEILLRPGRTFVELVPTGDTIAPA